MAQLQYPIINNFSRGELSSRVEGRVDLPGYFQGCKIMENAIMVAQGGAEKRPGTKYIGTAYDAPAVVGTTKVRLIPFEVSDTEIYILEFGLNYLRIWDTQSESLVQDGGSDLVINTEYLSTDISSIQYAQTEGIIFFAHDSYKVRKLEKTSTGFSFNAMGFEARQYDAGDSYTRGLIVAYLGNYYQCKVDNGSAAPKTPQTGDWTFVGMVPAGMTGNKTAWVGGTHTVNQYVTHNQILWKCTQGHTNKEPGIPELIPNNKWEIRFITPNDWKDFGDGTYTLESWLNTIYGAAYWRFAPIGGALSGNIIEYNDDTYTTVSYWEDTNISLQDIRSPQTLFAYTAGTYNLNDYAYDTTTFKLYRALKTTTGALSEGRYWELVEGNPLYGELGDYPSAITFMGDRLYLGGTKNNPQTISASKIGQYSNFSMGSDDSDSFSFTIASDRSSRIKWMMAKDVLTIGTSSSEWVATGGASASISPTNIQVLRQSAYGSEYQQSIFVADALLFFQKGGRKLREYQYSNDNKAYLANDLTFFADHITLSGISESTYQQNPDSILWAVRTDGRLIGLTYDRLNQIAGWHRHSTQGIFESVASVSGAGDEDELWFVVKRNINGTDYKYIEKLSSRRLSSQAGATYSDCSISTTFGETFSISNITWSLTKITITYYGVADFVNTDRVKITNTGIPGIDTRSFTVSDLDTGAKTLTLWNDAIANYYTMSEFTDTETGSISKSSNIITGLSHLEGESVFVLGDGGVFPNKTVSSGQITIETECSRVVVGLPYKMKIQPESIEIPGSSSLRSTKRISEITLKVYSTMGGKAGANEDTLQDIRFRETSVPFGVPVSYYTGNKTIPIDSSSSEEATVLIVHDQPLPMTILAIISDITYAR